ncbi:CBS domain-containing protein [Caminicella sporogenes DSM 14501]|uniref:CBS domain-containing protein n=1 Tax=Caminicella sporogenes DSM 14501 TaxID=1121266 RepID=A0A1M6MVQ4_9FIRM|nr:CBS domain-containing protein [Caminicella sporogenes]RKD22482.1 CBS domain-containing protein [Caminicella sporogenes]WIF94985.1 CBS domain-containing protein [Caminicella sporogenes]SHJ87469.1 CBS domain-containing protein [Caminicella sporogenes DSM 14501]
MKVRDLMTRDVTTADLNSSVAQIAQNMKDLNVGAIPVCDKNNNLVGIVTDRDIVLRNVAEGKKSAKAQDVMSSQLITVTPDTHVHEAARIMSENQIRRLPVVENGKLVGILSIGDFATQNIYVNEAGEALSEISKPSRPMQ